MNSSMKLLVLALFTLMVVPVTSAAETPAKQFTKLCAPCHGVDGKARTPAARKLGVKDLSISKLSDADIEKQIKEGRKGPDGTLKMPAFDKLSQAEIQDLIDYIKKFR